MKNIEEAKNETETRPFSFGMYWQVYGTQTVNVPINLNEKEALEYVKNHFDEIPLPEGEYVWGSDVIDEDADYGFDD